MVEGQRPRARFQVLDFLLVSKMAQFLDRVMVNLFLFYLFVYLFKYLLFVCLVGLCSFKIIFLLSSPCWLQTYGSSPISAS